MKWHVAALVAVGILVVVPRPGVAGEDTASLVYRRTDVATGATISLFSYGASRAVVEVAGAGLTIRKELMPGTTRTRLVTDAEDLTITLERSGVSVTDARLRRTARGMDKSGLDQARSRLRASAAAEAAVALLGSLEPRTASPISQTLLVTQALLESALGKPRPGEALARWVRRPLARVRTVPVLWQETVQQDGPTDCWDEYVAEAVAAWMEYEQCVDAEEWWDAPGLLSCLAIYDMRAIGAFSWWVSCVGFRG